MNDDLAFALRLEANDREIYDEEIIQNLLNQCIKNETYDLDTVIDSIIKNNFDDFSDESVFECTFESTDYIDTINLLHDHLQTQESTLINSHLQRIARLQRTITQPLNLNAIPITDFSVDLPHVFTSFLGNGTTFNIINIPTISDLLNAVATNFTDPVPVTLTENALNSIPDITYDQVKEKLPNLDQDEACSICFSKLTDEHTQYKYNILKCNHVFHCNCIKEYLKKYDYHCPICREECGEYSAQINEIQDVD